jgi:hypothetical protein
MSSNKFLSALSSCTLRHVHKKTTTAINNTFSRRFSDATSLVRPQQPVTATERIALRAARKERAAKMLNQGGGEGGSGGAGGVSRGASKYFWYATFIVPSGILVWGLRDEDSPPAKLAELIGLTGFLQTYIDDIAKPSHEKLLPDWSQARYTIV